MSSVVVKILLVEDNPDYADLMQKILHQADMPLAITCVEFLEAALACLQQEAFDALLLDLSLPDSTGAETYHRARSAAPHLPIVVLTGDGNEEIGLEAVRFGIQDYLVKGRADGHQVTRAIRYGIERKQMEDALKQLQVELEVRVCERTTELAQANEALQREMTERIRAEAQQLTAVMAERTRIAGEIHDTLAQGLTGIIIHLETADYLLEQDPDAARARLQQARALARDSLTEARRSVMALRPQALPPYLALLVEPAFDAPGIPECDNAAPPCSRMIHRPMKSGCRKASAIHSYSCGIRRWLIWRKQCTSRKS